MNLEALKERFRRFGAGSTPQPATALAKAIRDLAPLAYRDGATALVSASKLDAAFALVGLPRVEGREIGESTPLAGNTHEDKSNGR